MNINKRLNYYKGFKQNKQYFDSKYDRVFGRVASEESPNVESQEGEESEDSYQEQEALHAKPLAYINRSAFEPYEPYQPYSQSMRPSNL